VLEDAPLPISRECHFEIFSLRQSDLNNSRQAVPRDAKEDADSDEEVEEARRRKEMGLVEKGGMLSCGRGRRDDNDEGSERCRDDALGRGKRGGEGGQNES
jgi:hypothetical protein